MDVMQAVSGYISKMMTVGDGPAGTASAKMKILLLDSETVRKIHKRVRVSADTIHSSRSLQPQLHNLLSLATMYTSQSTNVQSVCINIS